MICNATLVRIDDPPPAAPGPAMALRCSIGSPTEAQLLAAAAMGLSPSVVLYLPPAAEAESLTAGKRAVVESDGHASVSYTVLSVVQRISDVLSHVQLLLAATTP